MAEGSGDAQHAGDSAAGSARAVVLVEGVSDRVALEVLARRRGLDLAGDGVRLVSMDGITNLGHFLKRYAAPGTALLAGLYDDAEERVVRRALEQAGFAPRPGAGGLEALGFFGCSADLEDELIRALGPEEVVRLVAGEGRLRSFRTLQKQPAQRERSLHEQLHRMMGARSGAKERYAALMAGAVPPDRVPRPLDAVLEHVYTKSGNSGISE